jgi:hypothetical protein
MLGFHHVILDDFGEGNVMVDPNLAVLLEYYDRGVVAKVNDKLSTRVFPLRGALYVTGSYVPVLLNLKSYTERLWVVDLRPTRNMIETLNVVFNSIIKDADYYRWALSRLYLYFHEYYLSLDSNIITLPRRRDPILVTYAINALLLRVLDDSKMPTLTVENKAENAKKHAEDVHMSIIMQLLKFLLKRRAEGFKHNKVFKFKGQDVEFYLVQYVHKLQVPLPSWAGSESFTQTVSIGATKTVSRSVTITKPRYFASPSMVQAIIDMYDFLNDYFIVAAPDGKSYAVWVRADAVEEAIRWLIFTLMEYAPHYLEAFPTLVDETVRKAYEEVMKRLEGEKFKNN